MMDMKSILIPVTIAGLAAGAWLSEAYKQKTQGVLWPVLTRSEKSSGPKTFDTQSSLSRLKDYMKSVEEKNGLLQEKNDLLASLLDSKTKELTAVTADFTAQKTESEKKQSFLNTQVAGKDSEITALTALKLSLETQVKELDERGKVLLGSQANFQNQLSALQQEKIALGVEMDKIKGDLAAQSSVHEGLNSAIAGLKDSLSKKEEEKAALLGELEKRAASQKSSEAELVELRAAKKDNQKSLQEISARLKELQVLYDESKDSVLQTGSLISRKNSEMEDKQSEISNLKERLDKVAQEREELLVSLTEKEQRLIELNGRLSQRESEIRDLEKEVSRMKSTHANSELKLTFEKDAQILEFQKEMGEAREREKELSTELEILRQEKQVEAEEGEGY